MADNEKIERTIAELDNGLASWVSVMLAYREKGSIGKYRETKGCIDKIIRDRDLDAGTVYFCYGDPDNPAEGDVVYERAREGKWFATVVFSEGSVQSGLTTNKKGGR